MTALAKISDADALPAPAPAPGTAASVPGASVRAVGSLDGMLRILTCGSVDDGKSTLIGRLLWDASDLFDDQREMLKRGRRIDGGNPDFSLLVDGLVAEREQGITIDIAWRYFDTRSRRFVVIDSPGHEQYTRNMASGASHADVAIMLVDARQGVKRQTRRHAAILDLMGLRRVVLAVNKMDLVDWSEQRFRDIERAFREISEHFHFEQAVAIPVSAAMGDNVAQPSAHMSWYHGPTLLGHLEGLPGVGSRAAEPMRFPVQSVVRQGVDFRGLAGTVAQGTVRVGDAVADIASGQRASVKRIVTFDGDLAAAAEGLAVVLELDRDIDVSRGSVLAAADSAPAPAQTFEAHLAWLSDAPFDTDYGYIVRTATDVVPVSAMEISARLDLETLLQHPAASCATNDIVLARIDLGRVTALEPFRASGGTGSFVIVDPVTGSTVAGGVVRSVAQDHGSTVANRSQGFVLSRALLERGLCADLDDTPEARAEFKRRASEVALILKAAGIAVTIDV